MHQRMHHQTKFEPRQMRAGAEMLALAERDLFVGRPFNVEAIRVVESLLVEIPRGEPQRQHVALANRLAAELYRARRSPPDMRNLTAPAQKLFHRRRPHR